MASQPMLRWCSKEGHGFLTHAKVFFQGRTWHPWPCQGSATRKGMSPRSHHGGAPRKVMASQPMSRIGQSRPYQGGGHIKDMNLNCTFNFEGQERLSIYNMNLLISESVLYIFSIVVIVFVRYFILLFF